VDRGAFSIAEPMVKSNEDQESLHFYQAPNRTGKVLLGA